MKKRNMYFIIPPYEGLLIATVDLFLHPSYILSTKSFLCKYIASVPNFLCFNVWRHESSLITLD